jgi:mannosyltransferase OCH1-like enzyme
MRAAGESSCVRGPIPRILHQTWKTENVPARWQEARRSWLAAHPGWEHRFWTDDDLDRLVRTRAPGLYPLWRAYPWDIQRVDSARYLMLHELGGVYADLDLICLRPLDDLLDHDLVLARTRPLGLTNALMMSRPGHPLMKSALDRLPNAYARWQRAWLPRHFRVLLTTGPLFITGCRRALGAGEVASTDASVAPGSGDRILGLDEYGYGAPERSYVRHIPGGSWEEWDSKLFNFAYQYWAVFAGTGAAAGAAILSLLE